jgi:hypothetical protein
VAQVVRCGVTTIYFRMVGRLPGTAPCPPDVVCQPRLSKDTAGNRSLRYSWRLTATSGPVRGDADWCLSFLGLVDLRSSLGGGFCYTREKPPNYQLSSGSMNDESLTQDSKSHSRTFPCPRSSRQRAGTNLAEHNRIVRVYLCGKAVARVIDALLYSWCSRRNWQAALQCTALHVRGRTLTGALSDSC